MAVRKLYKTVGDPNYEYVEVTQMGARCTEIIAFNENDPIREQLGYSIKDLGKATDVYWYTRKAGQPDAEYGDAGQPDAGQFKEAVELLVYARRGDGLWMFIGLLESLSVRDFAKTLGFMPGTDQYADFVIGKPLHFGMDGFDTWILRQTRVSLPA